MTKRIPAPDDWRCVATTKRGTRCMNSACIVGGKCDVHDPGARQRQYEEMERALAKLAATWEVAARDELGLTIH
jgi:hypothetical protein